MAVFKIGVEFSRDRLLDPDYDPIGNGDVDLDDLKSRYLSHVDLNHAAAIRGILVREGN